jgi:hypothetical protein
VPALSYWAARTDFFSDLACLLLPEDVWRATRRGSALAEAAEPPHAA